MVSFPPYDDSSPTLLQIMTLSTASTSFLRRLVDMLSENEDVISFYAGSAKKKGQLALGRIVVHDRIKVEADILPRYFNHSSFASLRRQLNYFRFTRIGKGRQRGAVYENEGVIELEDILRLRRRSAASGTLGDDVTAPPDESSSIRIKPPNVADKKKRSVSLESSSLIAPATTEFVEKAQKKPRLSIGNLHTCRPSMDPPNVVSPRTSPLHSPTTPRVDDETKIILDLTVPPNKITPSFRPTHHHSTQQHHAHHTTYNDDAEVLAGCRALLCFSQGLHSSLTV